MEEKDGKKPQRPTYPPCDTCEKKRIIRPKDVGKALVFTCAPRGHRQIKQMQIPQILRENLKQTVIPWLLTQANPIPKRPIQKTSFARTPNT